MPVVDIGRLRKRLLLGQQLTGIDRVTLEYLGWAQSRGHRCCVKVGRHLCVLPRDLAEVILQQATSQWSPDSQSSKLPPWRLRLADTVLGLRNERVRDALVINTSQSWLQEAVVWQGLKTDGNRVVCFVHDLIPITHPQYNREHARPLHEARLRMALRHAAGVIVNSRHTLKTLDHWAKGEGVGLPPTVVLPLGVSDPVRPASPPQAMEPSFVVLGTIEPRKNHLLLLRIWKRLVETGCTPMPRLVIVGKIGWDADPVTEYLADCTQIAPFVELRSSASDRAVRALLTQATALLFPSFAEGYGLPLVEALACGTPVIASPLPAFREIAGEVPDYVDPNDEAGWEARIRGFLNDETGLLRAARARLTDYHPRDWIRHFADLEAFLEGLG
jgi:glycosyltransferase involved in cell wall biosynthesis